MIGQRTLVWSAAPLALIAVALLIPWNAQQAQTPAASSLKPAVTSFRVLLGIGDMEPAVWDGSVRVTGGKVVSIQGWRFADTDSTDYRSTWKASTRRSQPANAAQRLAGQGGPIFENGVIIGAVLDDASAKFDLETRQGSFSFAASQVPLGTSVSALNARAAVDRVPATQQLTTSDEEQDFPAVAQSGDDVYVAYVEFVHGDRAQARQGILQQEPTSFNFLARPAGGDQVMLLHYSKSSGEWSKPMPVSPPGQDVMRTAVAIDGNRRIWVIWSANQRGNFDLQARYSDRGKWSPYIRVTSDEGTDINPVATTDAKGRVWIAWQAFRRNNLEILAAAQNGDKFSNEAVVSFSPQSDWDPAIAAAPNGEVAVSWDTYDKGDYDVYFRRVRFDGSVKMDPPVAAAASPNFEARSSIAYDPRSRLWLAYEGSEKKWGKDFGAYETSGVALYQGHNLKVKCFDGNRVFTTAGSLAHVLPGPPALQLGNAKKKKKKAQSQPPRDPSLPNPSLAGARAPSATPLTGPLPLNSFPRLAIDGDGKVFLAFRSVAGAFRSPIGSVWVENLAYFDGSDWAGPVLTPRTDGLLDSRPALAAIAPGRLLMVSTTDHRQSQPPGGARRAAAVINSDIYAADLQWDRPPGLSSSEKLVPLPSESPAAADPEVKAEIAQVGTMRDYRVALGSEKLQLMRGEFHRHTEVSGDGGRDGPVIDAYRYMIDAAYMDWVGCCDHDNGAGREYPWWIQQKLTDAYKLGSKFVPMFSYERSVRYPEGHRNVVFARRGVRPLPRLPKMEDESPPAHAPDTQMLYKYLRHFDGIAAMHTSGTDMGTDWRDNDPRVEPVVEIYQGDRQNYEMPAAPRSNRDGDSIGGWRPLGFVSLALQKGYRLGFQASSDHISTHMSYCNLWVTAPTREAILDAFKKRRIYGATENILADVRCAGHFMGEEFTLSEPPSISVKLKGTAPFAKVHVIKDNNYAYSVEPKTKDVDFVWKDNAAERGKTSYYYVRGEQSDGELVWVSPMWITYK